MKTLKPRDILIGYVIRCYMSFTIDRGFYAKRVAFECFVETLFSFGRLSTSTGSLNNAGAFPLNVGGNKNILLGIA